MKRMRSRNHRPGNGGGGGGYSRNQQNGIPLNRNHVFDSSGPEMRLRGTAQQLHEKYTQLARDASSAGDRVTGEAYYQHAEHYFRIISAINQAQGQPPQMHNAQQTHNAQQNGQHNSQQNGYGGGQPAQNNDYRRPQTPYATNGYGHEQAAEPAEPRASEPRQPMQRPDYQERRQERPTQPQPQGEPRFDRRIDISSALEAELEAAAAPAFSQPATTAATPEPAAPEPRSIPILAAPPQETPAVPARRPRGRPRLPRPEAKPEGQD